MLYLVKLCFVKQDNHKLTQDVYLGYTTSCHIFFFDNFKNLTFDDKYYSFTYASIIVFFIIFLFPILKYVIV